MWNILLFHLLFSTTWTVSSAGEVSLKKRFSAGVKAASIPDQSAAKGGNGLTTNPNPIPLADPSLLIPVNAPPELANLSNNNPLPNTSANVPLIGASQEAAAVVPNNNSLPVSNIVNSSIPASSVQSTPSGIPANPSSNTTENPASVAANSTVTTTPSALASPNNTTATAANSTSTGPFGTNTTNAIINAIVNASTPLTNNSTAPVNVTATAPPPPMNVTNPPPFVNLNPNFSNANNTTNNNALVFPQIPPNSSPAPASALSKVGNSPMMTSTPLGTSTLAVDTSAVDVGNSTGYMVTGVTFAVIKPVALDAAGNAIGENSLALSGGVGVAPLDVVAAKAKDVGMASAKKAPEVAAAVAKHAKAHGKGHAKKSGETEANTASAKKGEASAKKASAKKGDASAKAASAKNAEAKKGEAKKHAKKGEASAKAASAKNAEAKKGEAKKHAKKGDASAKAAGAKNAEAKKHGKKGMKHPKKEGGEYLNKRK